MDVARAGQALAPPAAASFLKSFFVLCPQIKVDVKSYFIAILPARL
jgi:hypothetical protein